MRRDACSLKVFQQYRFGKRRTADVPLQTKSAD
jgi:hypothetical protein